MFPPATCALLADLGHEAVHVRDRGVDARPDREVATVAAGEGRALVTQHVKDFAAERDIVVCVPKSRLPPKGMAEHLARVLDGWARTNPDPYIGLHWPSNLMPD